jgi:hypothetical protein
VRAFHEDIQQVLATDGVIVRREYPRLVGTFERLVRNGDLRAVLPGVYAEPRACDSSRTRIQAVMRWDPDAILIGVPMTW